MTEERDKPQREICFLFAPQIFFLRSFLSAMFHSRKVCFLPELVLGSRFTPDQVTKSERNYLP